MDFTVEIVSRNLTTTLNFVEFRDSQNFTFFKVSRVVRDTWKVMSGSRCSTCKVGNQSNKCSSGAQGRHVATHDWMRIQVDG